MLLRIRALSAFGVRRTTRRWLLTVEGERHTVALEGINPCVNEIVTDYLIDLELPADEALCTL